jgi:hypothetical protein
MEGSTLTLRALNDTKSAFGAVEFTESYFDSFELASTLKTFSCKVNVKVRTLHIQSISRAFSNLSFTAFVSSRCV